MKVSIITPFYEGNEYAVQYRQMMERNAANLSVGDSMEVIIVNDSPWCLIEIPMEQTYHIGESKEVVERLTLLVIENEKNSGIHASRIHGLQECTGEFVIFLDQDDTLEDYAVAEFIRQADLAEDVIISNAILENATGSALWYRTDYHKNKIWDFETYIKVGTQIISPGQCMIRKTSMPEAWMQWVCTKNGSDDYYLWLLLLNDGRKHVFVDKPLYTHRYTARNLSADTRVTDDSSYQFMEYLELNEHFPNEAIAILRTMIDYKDRFRNGSKWEKLTLSLKHPDLFVTNLVFKMKSKTPYGFNR